MQKRLLFLLVILLMSVIYNKNVVSAASKFKIVDDYGNKVLVDYTGKDSIVKVPQGVTVIDGAFKNNKYIKKIELSDSVQEIYDGSFVN